MRVVGVHIRRTDHTESIRCSPTKLFLNAVREEMAAEPSVKIFLATDDEGVKQQFRDCFADRVVTANRQASRDSQSGIADGLTDMYTLATTDIIYGSAGSTFSQMAAKLGGVPFKVLKATP